MSFDKEERIKDKQENERHIGVRKSPDHPHVQRSELLDGKQMKELRKKLSEIGQSFSEEQEKTDKDNVW